jgi:Big-like domain-containing protein/VCBS repeat protein
MRGSFRPLTLLALLLCLGSTCPLGGLTVVQVQPNLGRYRVDGTEPLVVTFNQPLNAATVTSASFWVTAGEADGAPRVAGSLAVDGIKVTFRPDAPFGFGVRHRVHVGTAVRSQLGSAFDGRFPGVTYGKTGVAARGDVFVVNKPAELSEDRLGSDYGMLGYEPAAPELTDPAIPERVPGMAVTEAWKLSTGRPDVLIAFLDDGMRSYRSPDLVEAWFLNRGELPPPRDAAGRTICDLGPCKDLYDFDGNGRLNVLDYRKAGHAIARSGHLEPIADTNGDGQIDPGDLIDQFADGADGYAADPQAASDGNGLADDISGYDFVRGVPQAFGLNDFPEGAHGEGRSKEAVARADGQGDIGVCPNCSVMVVRVTYTLIGEGESFRRGLEYALSMRANVVVGILGALNGTAAQAAALDEADAAGVPVITGQGDESSFHHSYPSILNHTLTVKANSAFFIESYCTGYGANIDLAGVGGCSSTTAGRIGGGAGLLVSRARDLGFCATSRPSDPACVSPDLRANEIKQLLIGTAEKPDDLHACTGLLTEAPCRRGPDVHQGFGRVNLFQALAHLEYGPLPPEVQILEPGWFGWFDPDKTPRLGLGGTVRARVPLDAVACAWAPGPEADEEAFVPFPCSVDAAGHVAGELDLRLVAAAMGGVSGPPRGPEDGAFVVRVQASAGGARGQDRRVFAVRRDPDAVAGFPFSLAPRPGDGVEQVDLTAPLAPSLEASPALADLDGDGADEIILATSNGQLHVLSYDRAQGRMRERPGWPVRLRGGRLPIEEVLAAPSVADLDRDGSLDVVVASIGGAVYAFRGRDAHPLAGADGVIGLPDPPDNSTSNTFGAGFSFFGSPVLTDLDGDGFLDVVVGGADHKLYAFDGASIAAGAPQRLPGWPVALGDPAGGCSTTAVSISASVGAVDLDGDGRDEIVSGTSEVCEQSSGRLYAVHPDGALHPGGALVAGFPVRVENNKPGVGLTLPPLTTGILAAPASARVGGEVALGTGTFLGPPTLVFVDGASGAVRTEDLAGTLLYGAGGSGAFSTRFFFGGHLAYGVGAVTVGKAGSNGLVEFLHRTLAWEVGGRGLTRAEQEDFQLLANPAFADVDGDGFDEMIAAGGGNLVHAFKQAGEAPGWPKLTYGWHLGSPALGDLDGDGRLELVAAVREGRVFAWHTEAPRCGGASWAAFRHDNRRTGFLGTPIDDPRCP